MNGWLLIVILMNLLGPETVQHVENIGPFADQGSCLEALSDINSMVNVQNLQMRGFCAPQTLPQRTLSFPQ